MPFLFKVLITALIVAASSELAKRNGLLAALLVSLPLTSLLALAWLYADTKDRAAVGGLAMQILWMIVPSLVFFPVLFGFMKTSLNFWLALAIACILTAATYAGYVACLSRFGIKI